MSKTNLREFKRVIELEPGNVEARANYIACALRAGLLQVDKVAPAAYLYHKPSQVVMSHCLADNGKKFIYFGATLNRHEPLPLIRNLCYWGSRVVILATIGAIEYEFNKGKVEGKWFVDPPNLLNHIHDYAATDDARKAKLSLRDIEHWPRQPNNIRSVPSWHGKTFGERALYCLQRSIAIKTAYASNKTNALIAFNSRLPDNILLSLMRERVLPWALGEYR